MSSQTKNSDQLSPGTPDHEVDLLPNYLELIRFPRCPLLTIVLGITASWSAVYLLTVVLFYIYLQHFEIENGTLCALSAKGQKNMDQSLIEQNDTLVLLKVGWFFLNARKRDCRIFFAPKTPVFPTWTPKATFPMWLLDQLKKLTSLAPTTASTSLQHFIHTPISDKL